MDDYLKLNLGCGEHHRPGYINVDKSGNPDVLHDLETFPYPLKDNSCLTIIAKQVVEYIRPQVIMQVFDELWRIMKPRCQLLISTPYAGSFGYFQDPTHCNPANEATFTYFDPAYPLYGIYKPKPWKIARNAYQMNSNMEVILEKRETDYVTKEERQKAQGKGVPLYDPAFEPYFYQSKKIKNKARNRRSHNRHHKV